MAPRCTWTSKKASSPRSNSRLTSAGTVTRPAGFIETMLRTQPEVYLTERQQVNATIGQIDTLTTCQKTGYARNRHECHRHNDDVGICSRTAGRRSTPRPAWTAMTSAAIRREPDRASPGSGVFCPVNREDSTKGLATPGPFSFAPGEIPGPHLKNRIGMASQEHAWWDACRLLEVRSSPAHHHHAPFVAPSPPAGAGNCLSNRRWRVRFPSGAPNTRVV